MARPASGLLAFALGLLATLALASCGGGNAKLLPGSTAREITENLESVRQLAAKGECISAEDAARQVSTQVEGLRNVDPKLQESLLKGAARLSEVVRGCTEEATEEEAEEDEEEAEVTTTTTETVPKPAKKGAGPEAEAPESPEKNEPEAPKATQTPSQPSQPGGEAKGHTEAPAHEETPSGGIGPGSEVEGGG